MDHEYIEPEFEDANTLSIEPEVAAAWQYDEEVQYRAMLAISYPQDSSAKGAVAWLESRTGAAKLDHRICFCGHKDYQHIGSGFCDSCECSNYITPEILRFEHSRPW